MARHSLEEMFGSQDERHWWRKAMDDWPNWDSNYERNLAMERRPQAVRDTDEDEAIAPRAERLVRRADHALANLRSLEMSLVGIGHEEKIDPHPEPQLQSVAAMLARADRTLSLCEGVLSRISHAVMGMEEEGL